MTAARPRRVALALTLGALPSTAWAHLVSARFGDFYTGLLHPLTAFENALPWLALGMFAGLQPRGRSRWLLLAFPLAVAAGAALAGATGELPGLRLFNLLSFVVLGVLVALGREVTQGALVAAGTVVGLAHGLENGLAFQRGGSLLLFVCGVGCAGYLLVTLAAAGTQVIASRHDWGLIAARAVGSWIAAIGIMMTGLALTAT